MHALLPRSGASPLSLGVTLRWPPARGGCSSRSSAVALSFNVAKMPKSYRKQSKTARNPKRPFEKVRGKPDCRDRGSGEALSSPGLRSS